MIDPLDAETGETLIWKLALWGTFQDKRAIESIEMLFPLMLEGFRKQRNWPQISEGVQLRNKKESTEILREIGELKGQNIFQREGMRKSWFRFSVPSYALDTIPDERCYIRVQGGDIGLQLTQAPHIVLSPGWGSYVTFSNVDFLIPPRVIGIAGPEEDTNILRALALYLNSSLVSYYLFFHVPEWGVFRNARYITLSELKKVPVPDFNLGQVEELALLHQRLVDDEQRIILAAITSVRNLQMDLPSPHQAEPFGGIAGLLSKMPKEQKAQIEKEVDTFHINAQSMIDEKIFDLFNIPEDIRTLVTDFVQVRILLDRPAAFEQVIQEPGEQELLGYARELRDELDGFVGDGTHHGISITYSPD
ncbi:MAG: hypothetical protein ACRDF4_02870, partial [Rhabdochlamydiaceae bacterium]